MVRSLTQAKNSKSRRRKRRQQTKMIMMILSLSSTKASVRCALILSRRNKIRIAAKRIVRSISHHTTPSTGNQRAHLMKSQSNSPAYSQAPRKKKSKTRLHFSPETLWRNRKTKQSHFSHPQSVKSHPLMVIEKVQIQ